MEFINALVWLCGLGCFFACVFILFGQKNKRDSDWKFIVGTGAFGLIWLLYTLSQLFA